ncbi:Uncharacterized protein SCF082_LOCUS34827 [Durusdinium trenchii]|uniref:Uncharacterized protein n=1 Tax=Durusdinium trenchii TaxID=1381693 RepID=A0ABP0P0R6_9DINO
MLGATVQSSHSGGRYDVILTHFEQDKEFWESWGVVDCMASVPDKSQKQAGLLWTEAYDSLKQDVCQHCKERREMGRAPIRVVMDMEAMSELPRSYPPIVPGRGKWGSPEGSTTAFARQCQDGQRLLERQKLFNDGKIDPRYQWLEDIISKYLKSPEATSDV